MQIKFVTVLSLLSLNSLVSTAPAPATESIEKRNGPTYFISSVAVENREFFTPDSLTGLYLDSTDNFVVLKNSTLTPDAVVSPSTTATWYLDPNDQTIQMANIPTVLKISNDGGNIKVDGNRNAWSSGYYNYNGILKNDDNYVQWYGCSSYSPKFNQVVYFLHDTWGEPTSDIQPCDAFTFKLIQVPN